MFCRRDRGQLSPDFAHGYPTKADAKKAAHIWKTLQRQYSGLLIADRFTGVTRVRVRSGGSARCAALGVRERLPPDLTILTAAKREIADTKNFTPCWRSRPSAAFVATPRRG